MTYYSVAADASDGEDAFAAIKLTGLGRTEFLVSVYPVKLAYNNVL